MSGEKFQNKYRIPSTRARWHDYNGGAYFITIRTKNGEHFFGEIDIISNNAHTVETLHATSLRNEPTIQLTPIGQFLTKKIQEVTSHHPYAQIPLFVVMPNHWHAIVFIDRDNAVPVETLHATSLQYEQSVKNQKMTEIAKRQSLLCVTLRGIKSAVTKFANEKSSVFAWQTRFHDHIIRDQYEMNRIAEYIENNPATWANDCYNNDIMP